MILQEYVDCILSTSDGEGKLVVKYDETSYSVDIDELLLIVRVQVIGVELQAHIYRSSGEGDVGGGEWPSDGELTRIGSPR